MSSESKSQNLMALANLVSELSEQSLFTAGSSIPIKSEDPEINVSCAPVTIRWDSMNSRASQCSKVTLPVEDTERPNFEDLVRECQPASFGRGGEEILDPAYRKHGNRMSGVKAELYKMNIYSAPGGKFKAHIDTPRTPFQIGSLVVCLPSFYEGGQLVVRHERRDLTFDWSGHRGLTQIQWAAFYSDCEHEVLHVTAGHRLTLTYNLYAVGARDRAIDPELFGLPATLTAILENSRFEKEFKLGYRCSYAYPHTDKETIQAMPTTLKGVDKLVYDTFDETGLKILLRAEIVDEERNELSWNDSFEGASYLANSLPQFYVSSWVLDEDYQEDHRKPSSEDGAPPLNA